MIRKCHAQLEEYATKGYRTLCFAMAELDEGFYRDWSKRFHDASVSIERREQKLAEIAEEIETNLTLVGASAIEDKLQEVRTLFGANKFLGCTGDDKSPYEGRDLRLDVNGGQARDGHQYCSIECADQPEHQPVDLG